MRDRDSSDISRLTPITFLMKPLISYYGGKARIASKIVSYINKIPHTVYVEPFCGGAAVLFAKPRSVVTNGHHYREVINDTSDILISLYRCAIECPDELALKLEATLFSQSDHARAKVICKNPKDYTPIEIAWAYFVNVNCSFSKKLNSGWGTSVIACNSASTWQNRITSLKEKLDRLQSVHVSCEDALKCIDRWDSPQSLIYCDPPYPGSDQGHYEGYTTDDWIALCDKLDSIQGSYILSNYNQDYEPKSAQQRIEIDTTVSASASDKNRSRAKRTEILWICDRGKSDRADIQKLLNQSQLIKPSQLELLT